MSASAAAAVPPEHDVTHRDLWVKLTELDGKLDTMAAMMADRKEDISRITKDLDHLFTRQRTVESRLAQIVMLGLVLSLVLSIVVPTAATLWAARLAAPQVEIREEIRP